ncbi:hypothetical protein [Elioraea sp.]|uniref:hypothetical protein n=1 Tax=Elioraea sp. TaxID=2185103 RepID=UPI003F721EFD
MIERNVTAHERVAGPRGVKVRIDGKRGIGKTSQIWELPADDRLFVGRKDPTGAEHGEQSSPVPPLTEGPR